MEELTTGPLERPLATETPDRSATAPRSRTPSRGRTGPQRSPAATRTRRSSRRSIATSASSAAATRVCGRRSTPRSGRPVGESWCSRRCAAVPAPARATAASCNYSLTHGIENGRVRFPDEIAHASSGWRCTTSTRSATICSATGSTPSSRPTGELDVAVSAGPVDGTSSRRREVLRRVRPASRSCSTASRSRPRSTRRSTCGGLWQTDRRGDGESGQARRRPAPGRARRRRRDLRALARARAASATSRRHGVEAITDAGGRATPPRR